MLIETRRDTDHLVSALDPFHDVSPDERHASRESRHVRGRGLDAGRGACPRDLALRNAAARGTTVGEHHHAPWLAYGAGHACHTQDGHGKYCGPRRRQLEWGLPVRLDASRARGDWDVLPDPVDARPVEPAMGPFPETHGKLRVREMPGSGVAWQ